MKTSSKCGVYGKVNIPQPASPTMSVTRFSWTFSTILLRRDITGRWEKLGSGGGEESDGDGDDGGGAIMRVQKPSRSLADGVRVKSGEEKGEWVTTSRWEVIWKFSPSFFSRTFCYFYYYLGRNKKGISSKVIAIGFLPGSLQGGPDFIESWRSSGEKMKLDRVEPEILSSD